MTDTAEVLRDWSLLKTNHRVVWIFRIIGRLLYENNASMRIFATPFLREKGVFYLEGSVEKTENRIGVIGIIIESDEAVSKVNETLHEYRDIIAARLGLPYHERKCSVISIIVDADADKISALAGNLGKIDGVSAKSAIQKK